MFFSSTSLGSIPRIIKAVALGEPCKMVLVVRKDLNMGVGKIAAQCSHAAVGAVDSIRVAGGVLPSEESAAPSHSPTEPRTVENHLKWLDAWFVTGTAKIVVQARSEEEIGEIERDAQRAGLPTYSVFDAGRTQVASGSRTVLSVGPAPRSQIDVITGHLKLF